MVDVAMNELDRRSRRFRAPKGDRCKVSNSKARRAILRLHFWCRSHLALSIVNLSSSRGRQKRNSYTATSVIGKSGKERAEGRETRGWKILWDNAVEQRGWAIVSPRLSYRPRQWWFLLSFLQFPRPSPFTLHGAAGTFSRLASKRRTHVILTSGERRFQSSPRGRRRDPFTIHPVGFVDSGLLLGIF